MIKLFQPPPGFNAANPSPFCIKLETLLKMAELPYEIVHEGNPAKGPTGKIPFVEIDGKLIGDSGLIQKFLAEEKGIDFAPGLSASQKAVSLAFTRLLEEHLYWALVYSRWIDAPGWAIVKPAFFGKLPAPLRLFVPELVRKGVLKGMKGHGIGRLPVSEIYQLAADDLQAISDFLAKKPFMFGENPGAVDAALYGQLSSILDADLNSPVQQAAKSHKNLVAFTKRMRERYFPEL